MKADRLGGDAWAIPDPELGDEDAGRAIAMSVVGVALLVALALVLIAGWLLWAAVLAEPHPGSHLPL
jgi:hypothetical protein